MKRFIPAAALLAAASPACADTVQLKPLIDLRVRYENGEQDGIAADSNALTARLRAGVSANERPWSA
jgi:hypothetical protein